MAIKAELEYQLAQQSAEHHDKIGWHIMWIGHFAIMVLLKYAVANLDNHLISIPLAIFSSILAFSIFSLLKNLREIKKAKYERCGGLEDDKDGQHSRVKNYITMEHISLIFLLGIIIFSFIIIYMTFIDPQIKIENFNNFIYIIKK